MLQFSSKWPCLWDVTFPYIFWNYFFNVCPLPQRGFWDCFDLPSNLWRICIFKIQSPNLWIYFSPSSKIFLNFFHYHFVIFQFEVFSHLPWNVCLCFILINTIVSRILIIWFLFVSNGHIEIWWNFACRPGI